MENQWKTLRNLIRKILKEEETPKGVAPMHVVYFPSEDGVFDTYNWNGDEGDLYLDYINFDDPKQVARHSHSSDNNLLEEVREYVEDSVMPYVNNPEHYKKLLEEMVIRTFVVRVEEVDRVDPGGDFLGDL
jgi:hypothetical protein